jgi:hypothetical protein
MAIWNGDYLKMKDRPLTGQTALIRPVEKAFWFLNSCGVTLSEVRLPEIVNRDEASSCHNGLSKRRNSILPALTKCRLEAPAIRAWRKEATDVAGSRISKKGVTTFVTR